MESNSYENDRGATPEPDPNAVAPSKPKRPARIKCQHLSPKGHHCHMAPTVNSKYCKIHKADGEPTREELAAEILGSVPDLSTAASVNQFLHNVVKQFAHQRIERRDAITLAYLGQLLLNSIAALDRQAKLQADIEASIPPTIVIDVPRPDYSSKFLPTLADALATDTNRCKMET